MVFTLHFCHNDFWHLDDDAADAITRLIILNNTAKKWFNEGKLLLKIGENAIQITIFTASLSGQAFRKLPTCEKLEIKLTLSIRKWKKYKPRS